MASNWIQSMLSGQAFVQHASAEHEQIEYKWKTAEMFIFISFFQEYEKSVVTGCEIRNLYPKL
jgi:uncharacterized protein YktA (UPF0223 family)